MALTVDPGVRTKMLASIGKILPDFFGVFDAQQFGALYINAPGLRMLDPKSPPPLERLVLTSIIGMNDIDRFQREIYPQTRVLGLWSGHLVLRDMTGSEFTCLVKIVDISDQWIAGERLLYVYARRAKDEAVGLKVSDQEMLHALLETTPDRISFKDINGRYLRVSRAKALAHGSEDAREIIGKTDFNFFDTEHAATAFQEEQKVMKSGVPIIDHEERAVHDDGRVVWVSTTRLPLCNREGKLIGTYCISRDITARKKVEEEMKKNEATLQSIYSAAPVGIALVQNRNILRVNGLMCEIADRTPEEIVGKSSLHLYVDAEEHARVGHELYDNLDVRRRSSVESRWRRKDGTFVDVMMKASALDIGDSQGWRIVTILDVTEKKRAEQILLEKQEHLAEAQRIAHLGSWKYEILTHELSCSDETRRIVGWPLEKAVSLDEFMLLVHPDDRAKLLEQQKNSMSHGSPLDIEYRIRRADGEERHLHEYGVASMNAEGVPVKLEGSVLDITERKVAEQDHREMEMRMQLSKKLESVGMLAAGVAHEINTPTQYITDNTRFLTDAFTQLAKVLTAYREHAAKHPECSTMLSDVAVVEKDCEIEYLTGEIPRTLEQSLEGLGRISRIVGSLKEFSHPKASEKNGADLNKAVETTVSVSRHEWKYVADIVTELDPKLPQVECVLDEFNQALLNLVINASHAIGDAIKLGGLKHGKITIRTRQEPGWAIIEVEDTGTGIPVEVRDRIFDPFFTTKGPGRGTGQGLAIVQAVIVKGHNGKVEFTTEIGKGTTFRILLPITTVHPSRTGLPTALKTEPSSDPNPTSP